MYFCEVDALQLVLLRSTDLQLTIEAIGEKLLISAPPLYLSQTNIWHMFIGQFFELNPSRYFSFESQEKKRGFQGILRGFQVLLAPYSS